MQKKWMIMGGMALLTGAAVHSAPVVAQAGRGFVQGGERLAHVQAMVADLNLTDDQKAEITQIVDNAAPTVQPVIEQIERNHIAMRAATENGYDAARVRVLADQQGRLVSELTVDAARVKVEILKVLTPEQRVKVERDETQVEQIVMGLHYGDIVSAVLE